MAKQRYIVTSNKQNYFTWAVSGDQAKIKIGLRLMKIFGSVNITDVKVSERKSKKIN